MKKKQLKKLTFTNRTDILLGFEVECIIFGRHWNTFHKFLERHSKYVYSDTDGSIEWFDSDFDDYDCVEHNCRGVEIKTRPLRSKHAMELLQLVFDVVNACGMTNDSCGLHVNISSSVKRKMVSFNPLSFISTKLWDEILKKFDRYDNDYCQSLDGCDKNKPIVSRLLNLFDNNDCFDGKGSCVSFNGFRSGGLSKYSRVEIRAFGNKDYTKKFNVIAPYVKKIENLFSSCCGA